MVDKHYNIANSQIREKKEKDVKPASIVTQVKATSVFSCLSVSYFLY